MDWPPFFPKYDALPATLPVFPLTGVLLLPRGQLPLNIFEPRYIAMIDDALAHERLIGMVQPKGPGNPPHVYPYGCAGRITSFDETDDGRYLITLTGVCRFRIQEELASLRGYRRVVADWSDYRADMASRPETPCLDRARLKSVLMAYFQRQGITANWEAVDNAPDDRLVISLAMICPFDPQEKQALLEARGPAERADLLLSLIEMAALANQTPDAPQQ